MTNATPSPYSRAAELGIISGLIANGAEAIAVCLENEVTPASFYLRGPADVFAELIEMHGAGKPIDAASVGERIRDRGLLESIGGWPGFTEMTQQPPLSTAFNSYVREVVALETRRNVIGCCSALSEAAAQNPDAVPELVARLLQTQVRASAPRTWKRVVAEAAARAEAAIAGVKPSEQNTLTFGCAHIDRIFHRMRRKEVVVIAARPSVGKSSLMRSIVDANAKAGAHVVIFSLEVPSDDIADAFAATAAGVNPFLLGAAHRRDQQDFIAALRRLDRENLQGWADPSY